MPALCDTVIMENTKRLQVVAQKLENLLNMRVRPSDVPELCLQLVEARLGIYHDSPHALIRTKLRIRLLFWSSMTRLRIKQGSEI